MNWLDLVILLALAAGAIAGLKMGIIKAVFSLAGLTAGIMLALRYYEALAGKLGFVSSEPIASIVAFAIICVGILIIARLLAWALEKIVSVLIVGWLNRVGGAIFGVGLGMVIISLLLGGLVSLLGTPGAVAGSRLGLMLLDYFPAIWSLVPA